MEFLCELLFTLDERTVVRQARFWPVDLSQFLGEHSLLMLPPSVLSFLAENLGMAFSLNFLCPFSYQLPDFALYLSIFLHLHCFHHKSVHKFSWNLFSSILTAFASIFLSKSIFCTVIREFLTNNDVTAILKFLHWPSCLQIRVSALSVTWSEMNFFQSLISPLSLLLWVPAILVV